MKTSPFPSTVGEEERCAETDTSQPRQPPGQLLSLCKTTVLSPAWFLALFQAAGPPDLRS